ncbi:MAG: hypothetical protein Q8P25_02935 [Candidatus Curtissbacteria bacterium]|nr:hypothetical protein [Candidatus Curtissbacteria bacterium]
MKRNIYLGIDGVILTKGVMPALHLDQFLKYILANFSVTWLSTRCRGSREITIKYLSQFLLPSTVSLIEGIKPTNFTLDKTEGINFNKDFFWLDVQLFDSEKNTLKKHNQIDSWIELDLIKNPDQLLDLMNSKLYK